MMHVLGSIHEYRMLTNSGVRYTTMLYGMDDLLMNGLLLSFCNAPDSNMHAMPCTKVSLVQRHSNKCFIFRLCFGSVRVKWMSLVLKLSVMCFIFVCTTYTLN